LLAAGLTVVGIDRSRSAIAEARRACPLGTFYEQDVRESFPEGAGQRAIVASLVLHYFTWDETSALVAQLLHRLQPDGVLLLRVNSTEDHGYGASGYPEIGPNYYLVDGQPKRFFARDDLDRLFGAGWKFLHVGHQIIHRYAKPKAVWEALLLRAEPERRLGYEPDELASRGAPDVGE
jgi:SAM-dependent methyltransferase